MYLLCYYIFFTCRCETILRGLFTSYLFYYLLLLFSYIYFFSIISLLYYLYSVHSLPRVLLSLRGWVTSFFLSISSLFTLFFYTIPDLSVLPLWHTFPITRRVFHCLYGFLYIFSTNLYLFYIGIPYSLMYYTISICASSSTHIPYLYLILLHTTYLSYWATIYGYLLSLYNSYLFPHHHIFISHLTIYYTLFTYLYILLLTHILIFNIFLLIIYIIIL